MTEFFIIDERGNKIDSFESKEEAEQEAANLNSDPLKDAVSWYSVAALKPVNWQPAAPAFVDAPPVNADLLAAAEAGLNGLEYINKAHPEVTGKWQRGEAIEKLRAAIAKARA